MKILEVIFTLAYGGAERMVVDLSNTLSEEHDVTLCCILADNETSVHFREQNLSPRIKFISLGNKKGYNIKSFYQVYRLIRSLSPDIVHFHLGTIMYGIMPALAFSNIGFVHTLHSTAEKTTDKWLKSIIKRIYCKNIISPVTISQDSKDSFLSYFGFDNSVLIHNGRKALERSNKYSEVKQEIQSLKQHEDDLVFIHIARYGIPKNQQMLMDVFNRLVKDGEHLILVIIGNFKNSTGGQKIMNTAGNSIHFLGPKDNVGDYLKCSNAFCMTSLWEGLPISLLEALSCGVIPICTPAGGIKNIVGKNGVGIITEGFEANEYYNAVKRFIQNTDALQTSQELEELFRNNFSIETCTAGYVELFNQKSSSKR